MKILVLLSVYSSLSIASIDWTRLEMEMTYLENTESSKSINASTSNDPEAPKLARKSLLEDKEIPQLDSVFDSINTKLASPVKEVYTEEQASNKPKSRPATGSIPKDVYETLVD